MGNINPIDLNNNNNNLGKEKAQKKNGMMLLEKTIKISIWDFSFKYKIIVKMDVILKKRDLNC